MIKAIIYSSHQGFSKQYAYEYAIKTGIPIYSLEEAKKLVDGTSVIFFSWIKNGQIFDIEKSKRFNVKYYAVTGLTRYSPDYIDKLKKDNDVTNIYYLHGGIRYYKLSFFEKHTMKSFKKSILKKEKKHRLSDDEKELLYKLENGYEKIDLDALNALIDFALNENNLVS